MKHGSWGGKCPWLVLFLEGYSPFCVLLLWFYRFDFLVDDFWILSFLLVLLCIAFYCFYFVVV
jgi:hypothetical protein